MIVELHQDLAAVILEFIKVFPKQIRVVSHIPNTLFYITHCSRFKLFVFSFGAHDFHSTPPLHNNVLVLQSNCNAKYTIILHQSFSKFRHGSTTLSNRCCGLFQNLLQ